MSPVPPTQTKAMVSKSRHFAQVPVPRSKYCFSINRENGESEALVTESGTAVVLVNRVSGG